MTEKKVKEVIDNVYMGDAHMHTGKEISEAFEVIETCRIIPKEKIPSKKAILYGIEVLKNFEDKRIDQICKLLEAL